MVYDVIMIGAGAAGLFCGSAPEWGAVSVPEWGAVSVPKRSAGSGEDAGGTRTRPFRGLILEKGKRPGRKLLMSGSGQCNITHAGSIKDFIGCYGGYPETANGGDAKAGRTHDDAGVQKKGEEANDARAQKKGEEANDAKAQKKGEEANDARAQKRPDDRKAQKKHGALLRSCLYKYNNLSLMEFLDSNGVKTMTREDGKVFPVSMDARDVLEMLLRRTAANGFELRCGNAVERIEASSSDADGDTPSALYCWKVHTSDGSYMARTLIIATGGCSYPTTGSDGSMFHILRRDLGMDVTPLKPALSSIQIDAYPYGALSGISFDTAGIAILRDGRKIAENAGSLLFTHEDLSGPAILNISKFAEPEDILRIDYIYPVGYEQALDRLKAAARGSKASLAGIIASEFQLPQRFCRMLTEEWGDSLKALAKALTGQELRVSSVTGFHRAMATSGGVALSQMDLTTMAAKEHRSLYVIGEALDVDGITGGYNLQFAYSSGRAAAAAICNDRFEG